MKPKSLQFWHGRNSESDLPWLNKVFAQIPESRRDAIGASYNAEFLNSGRVAANERLKAYCEKAGIKF